MFGVRCYFMEAAVITTGRGLASHHPYVFSGLTNYKEWVYPRIFY